MVLQSSSNFQGRKHFPAFSGTICSQKLLTFLTYASFSLTWLDVPLPLGVGLSRALCWRGSKYQLLQLLLFY